MIKSIFLAWNASCTILCIFLAVFCLDQMDFYEWKHSKHMAMIDRHVNPFHLPSRNKWPQRVCVVWDDSVFVHCIFQSVISSPVIKKKIKKKSVLQCFWYSSFVRKMCDPKNTANRKDAFWCSALSTVRLKHVKHLYTGRNAFKRLHWWHYFQGQSSFSHKEKI